MNKQRYTYGNDTFWGFVLLLVIVFALCIYLLSYLFLVKIFGEENHLIIALAYCTLVFMFNLYLVLKRKK